MLLSDPVRVHMDGTMRELLDSQVISIRPSLEEVLHVTPARCIVHIRASMTREIAGYTIIYLAVE